MTATGNLLLKRDFIEHSSRCGLSLENTQYPLLLNPPHGLADAAVTLQGGAQLTFCKGHLGVIVKLGILGLAPVKKYSA